MTTSVVVKANHGWPVQITKLDPKTGERTGYLDPVTGEKCSYPVEIVPAGTERTVYVHSGQDILVHEIQPDEIAVPPT